MASAKTKVTFEIDFDDDDLKGLAEAMQCHPDQVEAKIAPYAEAALREYADMMTGEHLISSVTEVRERRLVALIQHTLKAMPDTHWIMRVFNVAPSMARSLLRAVTSKHRRRIEKALATEVTTFLGACEQDTDTEKWHVRWRNPVLIEMLNARLEAAPDAKSAITADPDILGAWVVPNGSYQWLKSIE